MGKTYHVGCSIDEDYLVHHYIITLSPGDMHKCISLSNHMTYKGPRLDAFCDCNDFFF